MISSDGLGSIAVASSCSAMAPSLPAVCHAVVKKNSEFDKVNVLMVPFPLPSHGKAQVLGTILRPPIRHVPGGPCCNGLHQGQYSFRCITYVTCPDVDK